ncbi:MAG: hypothetical protein ACI39U_04815 [Candidatus Cryptobacteroides sp.]
MENRNDILENKGLKENPFIVPEDYFRTMSCRASLVRKERRRVKLLPFFTAVAAVAVLVAGIWSWSGRHGQVQGEVTDALSMSDEEIIAYLIYSGVEVEDIVLQSED